MGREGACDWKAPANGLALALALMLACPKFGAVIGRGGNEFCLGAVCWKLDSAPVDCRDCRAPEEGGVGIPPGRGGPPMRKDEGSSLWLGIEPPMVWRRWMPLMVFHFPWGRAPRWMRLPRMEGPCRLAMHHGGPSFRYRCKGCPVRGEVPTVFAKKIRAVILAG